jgi:hypothetical protein
VYKACDDAPDSFKNVMSEVSSLRSILDLLRETIDEEELSPERKDRLLEMGKGSQDVLLELNDLIDKYHTLGRSRSSFLDIIGFASKDIGEIRQRLISQVTLLTALQNEIQM